MHAQSRFLPLLVAALAVSGCVAHPAQPVSSAGPDCDPSAAPLHVVIGVSGHNLAPAARRAALRGVLDQLTRRVQPGSGALTVRAYPLADRSLAADPLKLDLPCLPTPPDAPDLVQTPTFERGKQLNAYRAALGQTRQAAEQARGNLASFGTQLLGLEPRSTSTDVWGFLALAADELATTDASQRVVIVVARDEEVVTSYCDGCQPLHGASVHFLAFDQLTPADQQRRRADWSAWLAAVGARSTTFTRSNETIPPLFGQEADHA